MIGSERSLLVLEDSLDLGHLKILLGKYELNSTFIKDRESFLHECSRIEYDLLVVSGAGAPDNNLAVIDALHTTRNSITPVLLIIDNNEVPPVEDMLRQELNIITFPFSPQEFVYRSYRILRSVETEENIHNSLLSYKNLFDSLKAGIIRTDRHGKFIQVNARFTTLIDIEEQYLLKENFFQLCHPDDYFLERKQLDRLLRKEISHVAYEIRLINNEGKTLVCSVEASILWDSKDIFNSFVFVVRLIS